MKILLRDLRTTNRGEVVNFNIGTTGHGPGMIAALERYLPESDVVVWASAPLSDGIARMMTKRFPRVKIVHGSIGHDGSVSTQGLANAVAWCDLLLGGSGTSVASQSDVAGFIRKTGKPYGSYGIGYVRDLLPLMSQSVFTYFRESESLRQARNDGITCPTGFGPDGAFMCDVRDEPAAEAFLKQHGLKEGTFICCVPRARFTPRWEFFGGPVAADKQARNNEMKERDNRVLRDAICAVVRETGVNVLVCAEDATQTALGKEVIADRLPPAVRERVVCMERFWQTDEALSVYTRSLGVFGLEMHSPVMAIGNGVPAIVGRFAEQGCKGAMWRDIGLGNWLFDFDKDDDVARFTPAVLDLIRKRERALETAARARAFLQKTFCATLQKVLKAQ